MRFALSLSAFLLATTPALAQTAPQAPISEATLKRLTERLSSDEFEGRAPGTPGEEKTVALLAQAFEKAGLKPGNNGSWFQEVPLVEITASDVQPLVFAGGKTPLSFDYRTDMVVASYRLDPSISLKDSEVVFVGYGVNAPERGWNDYAGVDVKGKTVVILVNDPDWQTEGLEGTFGGKAMTYYGRWTYKYEEAARQGAAAAIIVHQSEPASYGWNVVQSSWTGPQWQMEGAEVGASQAIGWLQLDATKTLFASAGQDFEALSAAAARPGFKAVPLGLTASTSFKSNVRRQASKNVIAILPGTERPDEVVMHTAHWDHLGRCDAVDGDDICNGAIDNATGTAAMVALAEAHAKAGPAKRTLAFMAVTAEESGLLGAKYYAANPVFPLNKTVGGVNVDSLPMAGATRNYGIVGPGKSELEAMLRPIVAAQNRVLEPAGNPAAGGYYRSDHFAFAQKGVPMLYGGAGSDLVEGGEAAHKVYSTARAKIYHAPGDEYDPNWDWGGAMQDLRAYYTLSRQLAEGNAWPNWVAGDEFRAVRDASRAEVE
ncbi:M28 family metallopeptidase [Sphingomonas sp. AX6]|uniref:M28 family metallopeptidase n=1 Tax=Sphingomonas sp. AX6 TaxID=2653171 RepID=UPI0012F4753C|nr:M28 family metallopeptidase [Sphingomonas sp. AX6]VXC82682.1 Peptidase M28 [Sphingomonas sp. AX6]